MLTISPLFFFIVFKAHSVLGLEASCFRESFFSVGSRPPYLLAPIDGSGLRKQTSPYFTVAWSFYFFDFFKESLSL